MSNLINWGRVRDRIPTIPARVRHELPPGVDEWPWGGTEPWHSIMIQDDLPYEGFEGTPWSRQTILTLGASRAFSIPISAWETDTTYTNYNVAATVLMSGVMQEDSVRADFDEQSIDSANNAGVASVVASITNGQVRFFAEAIPDMTLGGLYTVHMRGDI